MHGPGAWGNMLIQAEDIFQGHTSAVPAFTRRLGVGTGAGHRGPGGPGEFHGGSMGDPPFLDGKKCEKMTI